MTGRQFEDYLVRELHKAGYWVHRIHPDESGQQPFDIIAIRGARNCFYDAKVVTDKKRFPLSRIEDNQYNAFDLIEKKTAALQIGLLIYWNDGIHDDVRFLGLDRIHTDTWLGKKSIDMDTLPVWRPL